MTESATQLGNGVKLSRGGVIRQSSGAHAALVLVWAARPNLHFTLLLGMASETKVCRTRFSAGHRKLPNVASRNLTSKVKTTLRIRNQHQKQRGDHTAAGFAAMRPNAQLELQLASNTARVLASQHMDAEWVNLSDDELLKQKISHLGLKLEGSELQPLIQQLYDELSQKGLVFHPPCHVGDEWFVPVGIPAIFIPFFLVHERLRRLERKMILEVEGETPEWFMRLMRHEAAHAYAYAYQLYKKKKWQRAFGLTSTEETPQFYRPRPYSHSYVVHLDDWYAQSHPDEDFAETFAVWLTPGLDWRARFKGWKALEKLEYVDELMRSIAGKPPIHLPEYRVSDHDCLNIKLKTHYAKKRKLYEDSYPDFYDNDLKQLFTVAPEAADQLLASVYLRQRRGQLLKSVCEWTNEKKYRVNKLLTRLIERCDELDLHIKANDTQQSLQVSAYITTLVMNYLFTGKFKRTK